MLRIDNILVARDFSPSSGHALSYAVDLARQTGSALHLVHAHVFLDDLLGAAVPDRDGEREDGIRERLLQDVDGTPLPERYPEIELHAHSERDVAAAPVILNYAAVQDIDLIVMGTRGQRGVQRALLGSVAEEIVRRASQPVLTVHSHEEEDGSVARPSPIERILVPVDFSDPAREALRHAHAVAALYDATLDLLHVTEPHLHPAFYGDGLDETYDLEKEQKADEELHDLFEAVRPPADSEGKPLRRPTMEAHVAAGRPAAEILRFAEEQGSDLIVMSTHGLTGLQRFMMGSVAEKVVRHVRIPVFTVKAFGTSLVESPVEPPVEATRGADR